MQTASFENCCDFHCWVIKYDKESIFGKVYTKDSLKDSGDIVPLLWEHRHFDINAVLGCATLEYRDEGVYAYCKLFAKPGLNLDTTKIFLKNKGSVSLAPFVTQVKYNGNNVIHGVIKEVSLIFDRIDRDEVYFPIVSEEDCVKEESNGTKM